MSIEKWRHGYDGLLAAVLQRAKWDLAVDVTPARAKRLVVGAAGNTLTLDACRFALSVGFDCPAREIGAFLESDHLRELLTLIDCDEILKRIG